MILAVRVFAFSLFSQNLLYSRYALRSSKFQLGVCLFRREKLAVPWFRSMFLGECRCNILLCIHLATASLAAFTVPLQFGSHNTAALNARFITQIATLALAELCFTMQFLQWSESLQELNKFML